MMSKHYKQQKQKNKKWHDIITKQEVLPLPYNSTFSGWQ
jgi:hypothetical protein